MILDFDTSEYRKLTKALTDLHRSAFPVAIRQTLNNLAFDTKEKQILKTAGQIFTVRDKNFLKRFSKTKKANGFDVNSFQAQAGMVGEETKDFHELEQGGAVESEAVPQLGARTSGSESKKVRKTFRFGERKILRVERGKQHNSDFIKKAYLAKRDKKLLGRYGNVYQVTGFRKNKKDALPKIKMKLLYKEPRGKKVDLKSYKLIETAATESVTKKGARFFKVAVNKQFKKYTK